MPVSRIAAEYTEKSARKSGCSSLVAQLARSLAAAAAVACTDPHFGGTQDKDAQFLGGELAADASGPVEAGERGWADASFVERDARAPDAPADAAASNSAGDGSLEDPTSASFPSWAAPLLGTYAAQVHSFASDNYANVFQAVSRLEEISLVHIVHEGEHAELRMKLCSYRSESANDELRMVDPVGLPEIRRKISFALDGSFSTDAAPWGIGYTRDMPAECIGKENQQVAKRPGQQSWLAGDTCKCPTSVQVGPLAEDCRVLDPDNDNKPGLTFTIKGKSSLTAALIDETIHAVLVDRSHIVNGRVDPSRTNHYGNLVVDGVAYQFPCERGSNCTLISQVARPCTSEHNGVRFHRLSDAEWDCNKLLANISTFFPMPTSPPSYPTACSQQLLTDDPNRR